MVQCIEAAGEEFVPKVQKSLLKVRPHYLFSPFSVLFVLYLYLNFSVFYVGKPFPVYVFDPSQSANFGKGFLGSEIPPDIVNAFVETCRELRVLNNVRLNKIGIPITLRQYPCILNVSWIHICICMWLR